MLDNKHKTPAELLRVRSVQSTIISTTPPPSTENTLHKRGAECPMQKRFFSCPGQALGHVGPLPPVSYDVERALAYGRNERTNQTATRRVP